MIQAEGEQKCTSSASHIPESWRRANMGSASRSRQGGTGPVPGNNVSLTSWRRGPQRSQPMGGLAGAHVI
ncbi:hypothetical protein D4764_06G0000920 [Takifugu flavidus]|uniref:Uncharacterized protein n=1 Tax=Takifugu flavidus TaxID=433684 RepID=A0A5C6MTJ5_9TELE|nr:hypothetical protein D4764_06G0000920 [Takifugu flavidus]